jgi:hexokinase
MPVKSDHFRPLKPFTQKDLLGIKAEFIRQSQTSAIAKPASLAWFDSLVNPWEKDLLTHQPVVIMDFGGSYFRTGVVETRDGREFVWRRPLSKTKVVRQYPDADTYINWLVDRVAPLIKKYNADRVGFVFSQAMDNKKSNGHITGISTFLSKALIIPGLVGQDVGKLFLRALSIRGLHIKRLAMLNDTVALALCVQKAPVALVIGTGGNLCSIHPQLPYLRNLEAGHFDGVRLTQAAIYADLVESPGKSIMEKQSTGLYQFQNLAFASLQAGLRPEISQAIMTEGKKSESLLVSQASRNEFPLLKKLKPTAKEKQTLRSLSQTILQNAYQMWAASIAAVIELNKAKIKTETVNIPVTGGVILNDADFYNGLKTTIESLTDRKIELVKVSDPIIGAAVAALIE